MASPQTKPETSKARGKPSKTLKGVSLAKMPDAKGVNRGLNAQGERAKKAMQRTRRHSGTKKGIVDCVIGLMGLTWFAKAIYFTHRARQGALQGVNKKVNHETTHTNILRPKPKAKRQGLAMAGR